MIPGVPYDAEVEYLESQSSSQYINTGLKSYTSSTSASLKKIVYDGKFAFLNTNSSDHYPAGNNGWGFFGKASTGYFNRAGLKMTTVPVVIGRFYDIKAVFSSVSSEGGMWVDGNLITANGSSGGNANSYGIGLFCIGNYNGTVTGSYGGKYRIGPIKITSMGVTRDFIPVRFTNSSGVSEGAMYDRVSRRLFRNNGTGSFLYGPDVSRPVMGLHFMRGVGQGFTAKDYVSDGLIGLWDGIENAGWGVHDETATSWENLSGSISVAFNPSAVWEWTSNSCRFKSLSGNYGRGLAYAYKGIIKIDQDHGIPALEVVVKPSSQSGNRPIISNGPSDNNVRPQNLLLTTGMSTSRRYPFVSSRSVLMNGEIHSISCRWNFLSIDGVERSVSGSEIGYTNNNGQDLVFMGGYNANTQYVLGDLYCVRIYNRVLSEGEIATNLAIDNARFNPS